MSKTLVRYALALCVAVSSLTAVRSVQAAEEKAAPPAVVKNDTFGGKIEAVDATAGTITIKHKKETKTFTVAPDCRFGGVGNKKVTLADLKMGDHVKVTYAQEGDKLVAHHVGHVDVKKTEEAPPAK